jgi:hypothetical protein
VKIVISMQSITPKMDINFFVRKRHVLISKFFINKESMKTLTILSALFAIIAAGLWFYASVTAVKPPHNLDIPAGKRVAFYHGAEPIALTSKGKRYDLIATLHRQGFFNSIAAAAAGAAAAFQALSLIFPGTNS